MTILKFQGVVKEYDPKMESANLYTIGGVDFISEIHNTKFRDPVTVAIADARFTGDLDCWEGLEGYSEWTPGEAPTLKVGPHNLLEILGRYDRQVITLWIADEPINTLE